LHGAQRGTFITMFDDGKERMTTAVGVPHT
jgi:hypothetical protein